MSGASAARVNAQKWWEEASPVLDEAVGRLTRVDRELILGRFYRDQTYEQLAGEVNLSAEAVRKRLGRACRNCATTWRQRLGNCRRNWMGCCRRRWLVH